MEGIHMVVDMDMIIHIIIHAASSEACMVAVTCLLIHPITILWWVATYPCTAAMATESTRKPTLLALSRICKCILYLTFLRVHHAYSLSYLSPADGSQVHDRIEIIKKKIACSSNRILYILYLPTVHNFQFLFFFSIESTTLYHRHNPSLSPFF
jgi:hypothetical protein